MIARFTYNVLSAMKQLTLPSSMETARPKRVRFSLAARITSEQLADLVASRLRLAKLAPT